MACCVCGLRQAWGKPGSTGDIIDKKNNKIRNHPSHSPLTLYQPAFPNTTPHPPHFKVFHLPSSHCSSLPLHLCSTTSFLPHRPIIQPSLTLCLLCSQTFLNSIHFNIIMSTVYLVFIWHSLKQMVYWLRNTFIHVSMNMSEVLCTCWG